MSIDRYDIYANDWATGTTYDQNSGGEYVLYEDHIKVVDYYLEEIAAAKVEIDKLMSSLESWDEEFK